MRIAIPISNGKLAMHFGHCDQFALMTCYEENKELVNKEIVEAPPHEPGLLPKFLAGLKANLIIAGGMGGKARQLFAEQDIQVVVGAPPETPEVIVSTYLDGSLETGTNLCDH